MSREPEMSQNVDRLRRVIVEFNARDIEAWIAYHDPRVEFHTAFAPAGGVYHGHAGLRTFFRDLEDAWGDELRLEPEAYFDLGEHTLVFSVLRGRGRHSGVELTRPATQLMRWRDGLVVYFKSYTNREDALRDLGVSEDTLEPIDP
jgi:ketosteroid isomerase-like protein